jgi:anti-sigma regulatory factor (Ser/Thr protein kinase)
VAEDDVVWCGPVCEFTLVADPAAPRAARDRIAVWLAAAGWPTDAAEDIVYAVNEAVSNAAEHAYPSLTVGHVTVTARIEDDPTAGNASRTDAGPLRRVRISVCDQGRWRVPPLSDEGRRRGLFLAAYA